MSGGECKVHWEFTVNVSPSDPSLKDLTAGSAWFERAAQLHVSESVTLVPFHLQEQGLRGGGRGEEETKTEAERPVS